MSKTDIYPKILLVLVMIFFVWSGVNPHDSRLTWVLETAPFMIAFPVLLLTYKRFQFTSLLYTIIAIHAIVLMLGGHYSYAKVPLGFWMEDWFGWTRNNYDKIGHFMQGFGPVLYARELLIRTSPLKPGKWLNVITVSIAMAISAIYEIIEWLSSLSNPADTEAFLGTQGYIWDTQTDMFMCFIGAIVGLLFFSKLHDRYLNRL